MQAFDYFAVHEDYFWAWETEEEVICISEGSTIAYFQFIIQVLEDLADQGLPPFGSLLLAIIATNYSTENPIGQVERIIRKNFDRHHPSPVNETEEILRAALQFLHMLSTLPLKYTTGNKRIQLFRLLFAGCHYELSKSRSEEILAMIKAPKPAGHVLKGLSAFQRYSYNTFYDEFRCVALLLRKFPDARTLIERLSDIPAIEEPILPGEDERAVPGDFVQGLIEHPGSFPIGALIKSLWSGMSIPIHHTLPSAQPLGGFSDLTNKGDLDKLLIAEFAADDWLFLSRLANNEALYLHRETPPGADQLERVILVDVSLKSWGTPKVLGYAVLLAIAKHPKTDIHCTAYAVGNDFYRIAIDTVDEVIESVQLLDGSLHPAEGLIKFFERSPAMKKTEVFFIASPDTMRHPAIQKVISDHYHNFTYWVTVSQEGELLFYRNQHKGRTLIQRLVLPLEELWGQGRGRKAIGPVVSSESLEKFRAPILFPPPTSAKKVFVSNDFDLFAVTKERSLLSHRQREKEQPRGWQLVMEEVVSSASHFAMSNHDGVQQLFLCFRVHNRELIIYQMDTGESRSTFFTEWKPSRFSEFFFADGAFYYMNDEYIWRFVWKEKIYIVRRPITNENPFETYYETLQQQMEMARTKTSFTWSVLKNVNTVFINSNGNLVFNKHELVLSKMGHIQLIAATAKESRMVSVNSQWNSSNNEFLFPGACKVKTHRSGMLILQQENDPGHEGTSSVYIPAALDASLGVATDLRFAGNTYYYPLEKNDLIRESAPVFYNKNIRSFIQHILQCS